MDGTSRALSTLQLQLFGAPEIRLDGVLCPGLPAKAQALLYYLALTRRPHLRAALAALLWADMPEKDARSNLRKAIHQLQGKFGDYLSVDHHAVGLRADARCAVDAVEFLNAAGGAGPSDGAGPLGEATNYLRAVELYGGEFLEGFYARNAPEFEAWLLAEKDRLREALLHCLETLASHAIAQNDIQQAIAFTRRIVEIEPWREDAQRRLMELLAESGQRAAALKQYESCRQALQEELGVEPAPATQALYDRLMRQEKTAAAPVRQPFLTTTDYVLVGRQAEQQKLHAIWRGLKASHFVWIEGEAGIGKTRLAEDLLMLAEREELPVARAYTHALAGRLAYGPVADWLRTDSLRAGLRDLNAVWLTEVARLLPELLSERPGLPPPGPITDGWQRKRFFEALARAFAVRRGRLLLVLDDLQWCDVETLDWLHYLLDVADRPLLVVGTIRTEEADDSDTLERLRHDLARQNKLTEIHLNPLTVNDTLALAQQITASGTTPVRLERPKEQISVGQELNAHLAQRFYRDTGGNPLFIIETMRAAETAGDARSQLDDRKHTSAIVNMEGADGMPVPIPPKVMAVIQSRLQRLSSEAQTFTQVAATIGHGFDVELLAQATGKAEEDVLNVLDELWQKRIIREYDGACYDFSHDRIRDVAYAMINPVKRRLLHRQVAKALERIHGDDRDPVAGELAMHYQRSDAFVQALGYFRQAASVARRVYAHARVIEHLHAAIETVQKLPLSPENKETEINLWYDLGFAEILVHDFGSEPVGAAWNRAYELAMQTDSAFLRGRALFALQTYHRNRGQWRAALDLSWLALSLAQDSEDPFLMDHVFNAHGGILYHMGQAERAIEYFGKAHVPAEHTIQQASIWFRDLSKTVPQIRVAKALWILGQPDQAKQLCDEALTVNQDEDFGQEWFPILDFSAMLFSFLRDQDTVLHLGEELLARSIKYDYPFYQRAGRMFIGWALAHKGDAVTGAKMVRDSVNGHRDRGIRMYEPYWRSLLAEALALAGDTGEALSEVDQALAYADESGNVYWSAHLLKLKGDLLQTQSAPDHEVERWYQQAINTAQTQHARSLELRAATSLCRLWLRQGRLSDAHQLLSGIYGWFTEGFDTADLKEAGALLAQIKALPAS